MCFPGNSVVSSTKEDHQNKLLVTCDLLHVTCYLLSVSFVSVRSLVYHAGGQTRDVDPMPGNCWPTVYDSEPTLAQYWVTVSCLTSRWMWASITDGGPTLTQLLFKASCQYYSQHEVGLLTTVDCILASTGDACPTFNRHWVGFDLHCQTRSPANTRHWTSAGFMLGQRRRQWARIGPASGQRLVSAGIAYRPHLYFAHHRVWRY